MRLSFAHLHPSGFLLCAFFVATSAMSQKPTDSILLKEISVSIKNTDNEVYRGYLLSATDSIVTISSIRPSLLRTSTPSNRINKYDFRATDINTIMVRQKDKKFIGALIGLGAGVLIGVLVSPREPNTTPSDNIVGAIVNTFADATEYAVKKTAIISGCTVAGALTGALIAPGPYKRILINGRYEDFKEFINTHKNY